MVSITLRGKQLVCLQVTLGSAKHLKVTKLFCPHWSGRLPGLGWDMRYYKSTTSQVTSEVAASLLSSYSATVGLWEATCHHSLPCLGSTRVAGHRSEVSHSYTAYTVSDMEALRAEMSHSPYILLDSLLDHYLFLCDNTLALLCGTALAILDLWVSVSVQKVTCHTCVKNLHSRMGQ